MSSSKEFWAAGTPPRLPWFTHLRVYISESMWVLGQKLGRYTNWMSSKPAIENNMCAALALHQSSWQWTDENCNVAHHSICETGLVFHIP